MSGGPANETDRGDGGPDGNAGSAAAREQAAARTINQRIFETSLDLILVVDRTGDFVRVSPSSLAILGYRPEELVGRNAAAFLHPDDLERMRNEVRMARHGRLMRNFQSRYAHKDGRFVTLAWTGLWSEPEQQHFFIGRDMTERLAANEHLAHAQRLEAVGQLTGGVAHDFNNLLGVVIGNLDLLHERLAGDAESTGLLDEAMGAALRGVDVTRQLLAFARRQPLHPQSVDVGELVSGLTKLLGRVLGERIEISVDLAPDLWPVAVDPVQLEAALVNLATNARDAMPTGGRLAIAASNQPLDEDYASQNPEVQPGDYVMLRVSDTGAGMPREVVARIFEPFFTTKGRAQGTGLGLSMVFGFMKQSGGHINVYSEVGAGTIFRLYLPRDRSGAEAEERAIPEPASRGASEIVLVVEDNEGMRRLVARQLTELGYRVRQAASAEAALALIRGGEPIDLLFTDVVMPGGHDGFDLAQIVMTRWPRIRVVLTSGFPEAAGNAHAGLSGGIRLLSKPYRRDDLARLIRDVLDRDDEHARPD